MEDFLFIFSEYQRLVLGSERVVGEGAMTIQLSGKVKDNIDNIILCVMFRSFCLLVYAYTTSLYLLVIFSYNIYLLTLFIIGRVTKKHQPTPPTICFHSYINKQDDCVIYKHEIYIINHVLNL